MENGKPDLDDVFKKTVNLYGETLGITLYERRQHRKFNNNNNNKNYKNRGDYRNKYNKGDYNKGDYNKGDQNKDNYYTFKNRYNNNSNRSFRGSKKSNTSTSPKYKKTEEEFKILERPASKKV